MYKRVLLKLSGEALSSPEAAFDPEILKRLAKELKEVQKLGVELAIVVGGGNFIRGKMMAEMGMNRAQADYMGYVRYSNQCISSSKCFRTRRCANTCSNSC